MYISNFHSHLPTYCIEQEKAMEWVAFMHSNEKMSPGSLKQILSKIGLSKDKIATRYFQIIDPTLLDKSLMRIYSEIEHHRGSSLGKKMDVFLEETLNILHLIYASHLPEHNIIHVSCTGYTSPSPAQRFVAEKGLGHVHVTHSYHMGCYGAFPALRMARGMAEGGDIVHTEFCSLHMDPHNHTIGQLVIESLFADGFIKYNFQHKIPDKGPALQIITLKEEIIPDSEQSMTWRCSDGGFDMYLSKDVPHKIANELPFYLKRLANLSGLSLDELLHNALFAVHPGGPKIIDQVEALFGLSPHQLSHTRAVLRQRGNMSSATLPHVWQSILDDRDVADKTYIVSMAFGPGLTISGGILQKIG